MLREERPSAARIHERHQCLTSLDERVQLLARAQLLMSMTKEIARPKTLKTKTQSSNKPMTISSRKMTQLLRTPALQSMELT